MKLFTVIAMALFLGTAGSPKATKSLEAEGEVQCSSSEVTDLTEARLKARLSKAKSWTKIGPLTEERPVPGLKVSRQAYQVLDENSLLIMVSTQCTGTCSGGTGCGVSGCDPVTGGCNRIICTEGTGCSSSCTKVSIQ